MNRYAEVPAQRPNRNAPAGKPNRNAPAGRPNRGAPTGRPNGNAPVRRRKKASPAGKYLNVRYWPQMLFQGILFSLFFIFAELFFHVVEGMEFHSNFWFVILFGFPLGFFFTAVASFFSPKVNCIISTVVAAGTSVWMCTQRIYASVFQTYMEVSKVTMAGDVAKGFGNEMSTAIAEGIPTIIAYALITAVFSATLFIYFKPRKKSLLLCGAGFASALVMHLIIIGLLHIGSGSYVPWNQYTATPRILDNNVNNFGVMTSLRLELSDILFGAPKSGNQGFVIDTGGDILVPVVNTGEDTKRTPDGTGDGTDTSTDSPVIPVKEKNILNIDLDALIAQETDRDLLNVHKYVKSLTGSYTNEYTGMFEGYNLIMICAESFTDHMISEELTPTLYRLANGGFVFNNYYGSYKSITTNGEYSFCTGLIPVSQGNVEELKKNSTFLASVGKYLPYCMGNVFHSLGASTFAYHSNASYYYDRKLTHPNMGYRICRFADCSIIDGVTDKSQHLTFSTGKRVPNSDYETAQQTLTMDILADSNRNADGSVRQFAAYYMSYSGHHPYYSIYDTTHTTSPMTKVNRDKVDGLKYSEVVKSYLAANLEVEKMLTEIVTRLEEEGILDRTVIVLTNDHYPYGLTDKEFRELAGKSVDGTFGIFENCFICYNSAMTPVQVDTPCCTYDIIPTLLNLFGYDYDSRLLAGTDILDPKSFHVAMLYNKNFVTDKIRYVDASGKVEYLADPSEVTDAYVQACANYVHNKFEISLQILNNDYYKVFYDFLGKTK